MGSWLLDVVLVRTGVRASCACGRSYFDSGWMIFGRRDLRDDALSHWEALLDWLCCALVSGSKSVSCAVAPERLFFAGTKKSSQEKCLSRRIYSRRSGRYAGIRTLAVHGSGANGRHPVGRPSGLTTFVPWSSRHAADQHAANRDRCAMPDSSWTSVRWWSALRHPDGGLMVAVTEARVGRQILCRCTAERATAVGRRA